MHTQRILDAIHKAGDEMPIRWDIHLLEDALTETFEIIEHKKCMKQVYKKYNLHEG
jgi:hypothetical protein